MLVNLLRLNVKKVVGVLSYFKMCCDIYVIISMFEFGVFFKVLKSFVGFFRLCIFKVR